MAYATIAGYTMLAYQGRLRRAQVGVRVVTRDQIDGTGVLIGGWHAKPERIVTKAYAANLAAALVIANNYRLVVKAFKVSGTLVTVAEGDGTSWTNVAPLEADPIVSECVSPHGTHCVVCTWSLLPDTVVPT
jgi:hypothetical protein